MGEGYLLGEVFTVYRRGWRVSQGHTPGKGLYGEKAKQNKVALEEEFADVLSYLLDLANCFQVDLETAFREKEQVNQARTWE